jgi:rare lipoprotein A
MSQMNADKNQSIKGFICANLRNLRLKEVFHASRKAIRMPSELKSQSLRFSFILLLACSLCACAPTYTTRVIDTPGTKGLKGWEKPYEVNGERYNPMRRDQHAGFLEEGLASWYGPNFHGKKTSNGETYDMHAMTAAHKTLPLGVWVRVTSQVNGRQAIVRVNDRGPFIKGRIIDLSYSAARELDVVGPGTAPVRIEALGYRETDSAGKVAYRHPGSYTIGSYSVQVGAFTVAENARRLSVQLKEKHGHAHVEEGWINGNLFHRVRVGKYPSIESAETARAAFEESGFPNCFTVAME